MGIPAASVTSLTASSQQATHTKGPEVNRTVFAVSGTYGSLSFAFEGTIDGTNWSPVGAFAMADLTIVSGTISPSDNTTREWMIPSDGLTGVRANCSALTSGTAVFSSRSHMSSAPPVNIVNTGTTTLSGNLAVTGTMTGTSASASALTVGLAGATNPALKVDASTGSSATGVQVKSAAAAGGVAVSAISSGGNENMTLDAKGSGTLTLQSVATGNVIIGPTGKLIVAGTLTAGGLLTNAVQIATSGPLIYSGSGAPTISAAVKGSLYLRSDGSSGSTRAYIATDTAGTWTAITTAA